MNITPTNLGYEHILVFTALQAAKEGVIKSEYSGTVRLSDYRISKDFIKKCILAWARYVSAAWPVIVEADATSAVETPSEDDIEEVFLSMVSLGYINFDQAHNIWEFTSLNTVFGYAITSKINVPDWGVIAWGVDGIGGIYQSSDMVATLIDEGVTREQYLAQFPMYQITGSDIMLVLPGASALPRLVIDGWNPRLKDLITAIRSHIPVPTP
ncbi:hypothetical protein DEEACLCL_00168 [Salmonella phage CRW-SP2]|nr:hypothetical protein DEEACLCL_00168 [Salmonella phage CRW-SP2]